MAAMIAEEVAQAACGFPACAYTHSGRAGPCTEPQEQRWAWAEAGSDRDVVWVRPLGMNAQSRDGRGPIVAPRLPTIASGLEDLTPARHLRVRRVLDLQAGRRHAVGFV